RGPKRSSADAVLWLLNALLSFLPRYSPSVPLRSDPRPRRLQVELRADSLLSVSPSRPFVCAACNLGSRSNKERNGRCQLECGKRNSRSRTPCYLPSPSGFHPQGLAPLSARRS